MPSSADMPLVPPPSARPAEAPWTKLVDVELEVRLAQARELADGACSWVPAALWLLSTDPDREVRGLALRATQSRCCREPAPLCARLLGFFVGDPDLSLGSEARTALLSRDPEAALRDAPRSFKEEVLARLGADASLVDASSRRLLRRLSIDDDPEVQDNASWLLER